MSPISKSIVSTSHGSLAVEETGKGDLSVLFIHGNSSCCEVFCHQLVDRFADNYRLISFDLPGHGGSSDAPDPTNSYTRPGFADAATVLLQKLGVLKCVVVGWSLGGHIAIDMLSRFVGIKGIMIIGTPPVGPGNFAQGFKGLPQMGAAGQLILSDTDINGFVQAIFGSPAPSFLYDAVGRADGRFRKRLFEAARSQAYIDQRETVRESLVPIAIVNGAEDRVINLDYIDSVEFGNLWENHRHRLATAGHAPFWQQPEEFNVILERFLRDIRTEDMADR